jgi:hypothetical protein
VKNKFFFLLKKNKFIFLASGDVLDGLIKKFGTAVKADTALFVFSKHKIVRGIPITQHTITEDCWRDHCVLMLDNAPCNLVESKKVLDTALLKNIFVL